MKFQKDLLLVTPHKISSKWETFLAPSFGLYRMKFFLEKHGFSVDVVDPNLDPVDFSPRSYRVIGFGSYHDTLENDLELIHQAKLACPDSLIIAGGIQATFSPETFFEYADVDLVVLGEGERPVLNLLRRLPADPRVNFTDVVQDIPGLVLRKNGSICRTGFNPQLSFEEFNEVTMHFDFSQVPYQRYWYNNYKQYTYHEPNEVEIKTIRIFTSNYCPFRCTFCSSSFFLDRAGGLDNSKKRSKVIYLTPDNTVNLIIRLSQHWPEVRTVIFDDDAYTLQIKHVNEVCRKIIDAKENGLIPRALTFICTSRVDHLNQSAALEMLRLMKRAGFRMIMLGVESFSEQVLRDLNKRITVEQIWTAMHRVLDAGIQPLIYIIPFTPTITLDALVDTIRQSLAALTIGVEVSMNSYIWALPGTPIYESSNYEVKYQEIFIKGAGKVIRKPHFIIPEDPEVRSLAEQFIEKYPYYERMLCERFRITHMPRRTASLVTFYAILDILGGYEKEKERILAALREISAGTFLARLRMNRSPALEESEVPSLKWGSTPWAC